jgi:hypothetical protein
MNLQEHLLTTLSEECAETSQAISKALRFGIDGRYPDGRTNIEEIEIEVNHILAMIELLNEVRVPIGFKDDLISQKKKKVKEFFDYARHQGALS